MRRHACESHQPPRPSSPTSGMGFTGLALGAMLHRDGYVACDDATWAPPDGKPHFAAEGQVGHLGLPLRRRQPPGDLRPQAGAQQVRRQDLRRHAATPTRSSRRCSPSTRATWSAARGRTRRSSRCRSASRSTASSASRSPTGCRTWPRASTTSRSSGRCTRPTTTTAPSSRCTPAGTRSTSSSRSSARGSSYGLGTLNENLPQFVFLGQYKDTRVKKNFAADYLGPQYAGVELSLDPKNPLPFANRGQGRAGEGAGGRVRLRQRAERPRRRRVPDDEQVRARIKSYELAFRMQMAVPEVLDLAKETEETQKLYGIDNPTTAVYGRRLLAARRLAEQGVRFTLVYLSDYGEWDSHNDLKNLPRPQRRPRGQAARRADQGPEADRAGQGRAGGLLHRVRPHAGAGDARRVQDADRPRPPPARVHGLALRGRHQGRRRPRRDRRAGLPRRRAPHYVTDIHATVLDRLGLDPKRLDVPGRKRLEIDHGKPIKEICT